MKKSVANTKIKWEDPRLINLAKLGLASNGACIPGGIDITFPCGPGSSAYPSDCIPGVYAGGNCITGTTVET